MFRKIDVLYLALLEMLKTNTRLLAMDWGSSEASQSADNRVEYYRWNLRDIDFYLRLNRDVGRQRLMEGARDEEWINAIVNNRNDARMVHYLLSKKPSLCR